MRLKCGQFLIADAPDFLEVVLPSSLELGAEAIRPKGAKDDIVLSRAGAGCEFSVRVDRLFASLEDVSAFKCQHREALLALVAKNGASWDVEALDYYGQSFLAKGASPLGYEIDEEVGVYLSMTYKFKSATFSKI